MQKAKEVEKKVEQVVTKDTTVGDIIQRHPAAVEVLLEAGLHCIGCSVNTMESIGEGMKAHGMSDDDVNEVVRKVNEIISNENAEGDTIIVTEKAASKIKEILKAQNKKNYALRLGVEAGGCAGQQYAMGFEKEITDGDVVIEEKGVKIVVDKESLASLKGAKLDYIDALQGAGFKISNPNAHGSCACGSSFR